MVMLGNRVGRNCNFRWKSIIQVTFMSRTEGGEKASYENIQWESISNRELQVQRS